MRAIVQERYGSADQLMLAEVAVPDISADEVLVRVHAAGVDRGTWHLMTGEPRIARLAFGVRGPKQRVPGLDVAGTVEAVGAAVTTFAVGDEVFGIGRGSLAEHAAAKASKLSIKPTGLTFDQAAVVPVSGLTALQAVDAAGVADGGSLLVTGASGGVGSHVVQIAVAQGVEVTAVCSAAKSGFVRSLGASHVLDYARDDITSGVDRYDAIIDIAGTLPLRRLRRVLAPRGTIVFVGSEVGPWTGGIGRGMRAAVRSPFVRQTFTMPVAKEQAVDLDRLAELIDRGVLTPQLDRTYPLKAAPDALRDLEAGVPRGKLAIAIG